MLEKPGLFANRKEFVYFVLFALLVIGIRLGWQYLSYRDFISRPFFYTHATVVYTYPKEHNGKKYRILKLSTDEGKTVYTKTYRHDDLKNKKIYLQLIPSPRINFWDYLGGMYCKSHIKRVESIPQSIADRLYATIASQHPDKAMKEFYGAIFLARPISKELRGQIASLGASHLVALSGFHLGILWAVLYAALLMLYRPLQQRFFPYRYSLRDVGVVVMLVLGVYLWLTDFPPSLIRSYAMLLAGWIFVLLGIELVSFGFLSTITLLLLVMFPQLIVSLGFWLSVAGVFYIFLILRYCQDVNKWLISLLCIPVGIFILMQPVSHYFFGVTTLYQLLSPVLSILFVLFYPLVFALHLIGQGNILDNMLKWLLELPVDSISADENLMPLWGLVGYIVLSAGAIWSRMVFYLLLVVAVGYNLYLLYLLIFVKQIT